MQREEIARLVTSAISAVLRRPIDGAADISRRGIEGWDSLKHMEILLAIEESAGVQFTEEEFSSLDSISALVDAVQAHHEA